MRRIFLVALVLFVPLPLFAPAADKDKADAKPLKALLVIGGCCHDYAKQKDILTKGISARANVEWTVAYDPDTSTKHVNPVYAKADWARGFDVVLHCGMHCYRSEGWPKVVTPWFEFTGLQTTGHGAQEPIAVAFVDKDRPITKGLEDWRTIKEELYNNITGKVLDTAHPLAGGKQGKEDSVVAWTNTYNKKTRVFCTTLGHNNETVADDRYLDLVTRGLLWATGHLSDDGKPAPGYEAKK